jgi:hypothetical protein
MSQAKGVSEAGTSTYSHCFFLSMLFVAGTGVRLPSLLDTSLTMLPTSFVLYG